MSTDKERIMTYVTKEDKEKITIIAKQINNRSVSNYLNILIKQDIENYEKEHGEIEIPKVNDNTI